MQAFRLISLLVVVTLAVPPQADATRRTSRTYRIGVLTDGPLQPEMERLLQRLKKEVTLLVRGSGWTVTFPPDKRLSADWSPDRIAENANRLLADKDVDLILSTGLLNTIALSRRDTLPKPVLAPLTADPHFADLPFEKGRSGKPNFSYSAYAGTFQEDIDQFKKLAKTSVIHLLVDDVVIKMLPRVVAQLPGIAKDLSCPLVLVPTAPTTEAALAALPDDAQAVYITPMLRMSDQERTKLFAALNERGLLTFSMRGRAEVERGVLATQTRGRDFLRAARQTALNIEQVLRGEKPERFPVELKRQGSLLLNMQTARAIGYSPSWQVLTYAELYKDEAERGRPLTLKNAVVLALRRNWDLLAARSGLEANRMQVNAAYSELAPQVDFNFTHQTIRRETAEASSGTQPQHQGKIAGTLSQMLLVEPTLANIDIQNHQRRALVADFRTLQLDIVAQTSTAFVQLLRAQAAAVIQKSNAQLTAENLEASRVRQQVGTEAPSDYYRWQSQLANDRNRAIQAMTQVNVARIALNQLMRLPQRDILDAVPISQDDPTLVPQETELLPYIENPAKFNIFSDFLVGETLERTPEVKKLDASIEAQQRLYRSRYRALYLPQVRLNGEISYVPYRDFTDTQPIDLPGVGPIELNFARAPRFTWFVGASLTVPFFTGLRQTYEREQAERQIRQLEERRGALKISIESRVRSALNNVRANRAGIDFAKQSAAAAEKNLTVVQDGYSRGIASTVRLLDAQNQALTARLAAATAVYDYHLAVIELTRAIADVPMFTTAEANRAMVERLIEYYKKRNVPVRG